MAAFSDDGKLKSQKATLANPCFLIQHPKGNFLWDTGYQEDLADNENGVIFYEHFHKKMPHKLSTQLKQISLSPSDITHVAISHMHDDHIGNANLFHTHTGLYRKPNTCNYSPTRVDPSPSFSNSIPNSPIRKQPYSKKISTSLATIQCSSNGCLDIQMAAQYCSCA